jgi:hypothetical protein
VGGEAVADRHASVAAASSQSSSTWVGSTERYAVRQVTAWTRATSAASSGRAGRTETEAVASTRAAYVGATGQDRAP